MAIHPRLLHSPETQASAIQAQAVSAPAKEPTQPRRHATGKIHNLKLGFGFIAPDDGSENAFFHATEVVGCTIFDLRPGDPVERGGVNEEGPCGWKVTRSSGNFKAAPFGSANKHSIKDLIMPSLKNGPIWQQNGGPAKIILHFAYCFSRFFETSCLASDWLAMTSVDATPPKKIVPKSLP